MYFATFHYLSGLYVSILKAAIVTNTFNDYINTFIDGAIRDVY